MLGWVTSNELGLRPEEPGKHYNCTGSSECKPLGGGSQVPSWSPRGYVMLLSLCANFFTYTLCTVCRHGDIKIASKQLLRRRWWIFLQCWVHCISTNDNFIHVILLNFNTITKWPYTSDSFAILQSERFFFCKAWTGTQKRMKLVRQSLPHLARSPLTLLYSLFKP